MSLWAKIFLVFIIVLSSGCQDIRLKSYSDCQCVTREPFQGNLIIYFTRGDGQGSPQILLMNGFYEEGDVFDTIRTDTVPAYRDFVYYPVSIGHYYTAVAVYSEDKDTVFAVDGDFFSKEAYYDSDCDTTCWKIEGYQLNVKLKK